MKYELVKQVRDDDILRQSFIDLAVETFDLSFEKWYQAGFWSDDYIPYCLVDGDKVIVNVSVNRMKMVLDGQVKNYLQLGTVMTAKEYRKQGLARYLLENVLNDFAGQNDGIYLFANETVLDFYPKFGFQAAEQYQASLPITPKSGDFRKLDMDQPTDRELVKQMYQLGNPYSKLSFIDNYGLLMFYCDNFMRDCLYYSAKRGVVIVAIQNKNNLECLDIFGQRNTQLPELLNELASGTTTNCHLGFSTPGNQPLDLFQTDETLFVYDSGENIFGDQKLMFPLLSHA